LFIELTLNENFAKIEDALAAALLQADRLYQGKDLIVVFASEITAFGNPWNRTTGILPQLPAELRNVIVQKRSLMPRRYSAGVLLIDDNSWDWRDSGALWLPSEMEVYGAGVWGSNLSPNQGFSTNGFVQYPIFVGNMKRVKGTGGGAHSGWWLLSVRGGSSTRACRIHYGGHAGTWDASNADYIPLCFRIV